MDRGSFGILGRREFLAATTAGAAAFLANQNLARSAPKGPTVVIVRDKTRKAIDGLAVDAAIVQRLVDTAVMTLAGKTSIAEAWAKFVTAKDRVAVKPNTLFPRAATHPEVVRAITDGLVNAGVTPAGK